VVIGYRMFPGSSAIPRPPAAGPAPAAPGRRVNWPRLALPVGALLAVFVAAMLGPPALALPVGALAVLALGFAVRNPRR
jgi:hypothetical protein